jgi:hypothetical protein
MPLDLQIARSIPGVPLWPGVTATAIAAALLGVLLARRKRATLNLCSVVFLLNVLTVLFALRFTNTAYAESGRPWVPFQANKLGMVTVALLAPELWVGIASIVGYIGSALVQMLTFSEAARARFALGEPWATIVIGVFSAVLLGYRIRHIALERNLARANAEVVTTQKFARVLLAVRDLSNTPLQTITLAAETARSRHADLEPVMALVDRSLEKLRHLDTRLREHEAELEWTSDEEAFDPLKALEPRR